MKLKIQKDLPGISKSILYIYIRLCMKSLLIERKELKWRLIPTEKT